MSKTMIYVNVSVETLSRQHRKLSPMARLQVDTRSGNDHDQQAIERRIDTSIQP